MYLGGWLPEDRLPFNHGFDIQNPSSSRATSQPSLKAETKRGCSCWYRFSRHCGSSVPRRLSVGRGLRTLICSCDANWTDVVCVERWGDFASGGQNLLVGTLTPRSSLLALATGSALTSFMHFMRLALDGSRASCSQRISEMDISSGAPASSSSGCGRWVWLLASQLSKLCLLTTTA